MIINIKQHDALTMKLNSAQYVNSK